MKSAKLRFSIDVLPEQDGKGYYVVVPALPGCFSQGKTVEQAMKNAKEAIALHVKALKKNGQPIPNQDRTFHTVVEIAA
ncbi:type II toxin-antitoxin system HicB family antitoxin [bacterium]|nr:MAG: type II toxin-antitoxin system HicB family antitoxin [bacterium]